MITLLATIVVWGAMAQQAKPEVTLRPITPVLSITGDQSRIPGPRYVMCLNQKDFDMYWERHTGQAAKVYYSSSPAPIVDFKSYMVVMIFGGQLSNSQGYKINTVNDMKDSIRIRYSELWFSTGGPDGGGVMVQPWMMMVVPRSSKKIQFEANHPKRKGEPDNFEVVETISPEQPDSFVRKMH